jgi:hypothetical protein
MTRRLRHLDQHAATLTHAYKHAMHGSAPWSARDESDSSLEHACPPLPHRNTASNTAGKLTFIRQPLLIRPSVTCRIDIVGSNAGAGRTRRLEASSPTPGRAHVTAQKYLEPIFPRRRHPHVDCNPSCSNLQIRLEPVGEI